MILLNGRPVVPTMFPDKTSQVWKIPFEHVKSRFNVVRWDFEHEGEIMHLAQLRDLCTFPLRLEIPYLPYARQDKDIFNHNTFALHTFAKILNSLKFEEVVCMDPHSDVALKVIPNLNPTYPVREIASAAHECAATAVCFPDIGARSKYQNIPFRALYGDKKRNPDTGEIESLSIRGIPKGETVLIVDDICDGGATFEKLARLLYSEYAKEVHLFVSHGLFTKGTKPLFDSGIVRIFTSKGEVKP